MEAKELTGSEARHVWRERAVKGFQRCAVGRSLSCHLWWPGLSGCLTFVFTAAGFSRTLYSMWSPSCLLLSCHGVRPQSHYLTQSLLWKRRAKHIEATNPTFTWISGDVSLVTEMLFALVGEACMATEIRLLADRLSKQASEVCLNSYLSSPLHSHWVSNRSYQGRRASLNPWSLETPKGSLFGWLLKFPQIWKPATRQCTWSSQHRIESFPAAIVVTEGR